MGKNSKNNDDRVRNRGTEIGYCSICRKKAQLSRDHVPPKGCGNIHDVSLTRLLSKESKPNYSQGGHHFKTICQQCNSFIGRHYDPVLIKLCNEVLNFIKAKHQNIIIPAQSFHFTKPNIIAKSIIGHTLASNSIEFNENNIEYSKYYQTIADYVLDPEALLPDNVDIYFWTYPYNDITIIRFLVTSSLYETGHFNGDVIKFLPLAFWIVNEVPKNIKINHQKLIQDKKAPSNSLEQIIINYSNIPHQKFPEIPIDSDTHYSLFAKKFGSVASNRRK